MGQRIRRQVGVSGRRCDLCGGAPVLVMESRNRRGARALFHPTWQAHVRRYELCSQCGCRYELSDDGKT